jgi:ribonuclease R
MRVKHLARDLGLAESDKGLKPLLEEMVRRGAVYRVKGGRYAAPDRISLVTGRVSTIRSGDAFLRPDEADQQDVFIPGSDLDTAMDGDKAVVRIERRPKGRNPVGRVIKVLERAHPTVVGTFHQSKKFGYVVPLDPKMGRDIMIPWGDEGEADDGDVVVIRISAYGARRHGPTGEVERVLGPMSDPGVDILSVLFGHGLSLEFSPAVETAAQAFAEQPVVPGEGREDLRELLVFTIDPSDAQDHDDALSVRPLDGGRFEIGIHIADVSHYVPKGGPVDLEALDRGTSVYLVDRVIPMLPHALSSGACSLRPDEDRYAMSILATLNASGQVFEYRFARTVIRSRHKLDYQTVHSILDGQTSIDDETDTAVRDLDRVARGLRTLREERGSIDFDMPEARVVLDDDGAPIDIQRVERLDSHRLVEDFMLLANEIVAKVGAGKKLPVLYRVHEPPTVEKTENLREFLATLGSSSAPCSGRATRPPTWAISDSPWSIMPTSPRRFVDIPTW